MTKITRKHQKIFGGNSSDNGQFGSARAGTFVLSNDLDSLQSLPAWENGWNSATISGDKLPPLEESQAINFVQTSQIAYLFQEGIPEYSSETEYFTNSIVKESGSSNLFISLIDDNLGNALVDGANWKFLFDLKNVVVKNNYEAVAAPTVDDDESIGYSSGSKWFYSGDIWLCVDAADGAANWVDTGVNLDDLGALAFLDKAPNSNLADMPNATIKGRITSGSGAPEDLTVEELRGMLGASVARNHISGLTLSNAADANHDITVAPGQAAESENSKYLDLDLAMTKRIDASWAAGTGNGGLASSLSLSSNTWYHVFLIEVGGSVDAGFDTSLTAANLIADHSATSHRRIGSILTDGSSNIIGFSQTGNKFQFDSMQVNLSGASQGHSSRDTRTISAPLGLVVFAEVSIQLTCPTSANYGILVTDLANQSDSAVSLTNANTYIGGNGAYQQGDTFICKTNTSSQIGIRATGAGGTVNIATRGWTDPEI